MRFFHGTSTANATSILQSGFRDATKYIGGMEIKGVWISAYPLTIQEGANSDAYLIIETIDEVAIEDFEVIEEGKPYREWCVPATTLNQAIVWRATDPEVEVLEQHNWRDCLLQKVRGINQRLRSIGNVQSNVVQLSKENKDNSLGIDVLDELALSAQWLPSLASVTDLHQELYGRSGLYEGHADNERVEVVANGVSTGHFCGRCTVMQFGEIFEEELLDYLCQHHGHFLMKMQSGHYVDASTGRRL